MKTKTFKSSIVQLAFFLALVISGCHESTVEPKSDPVKMEKAGKVLSLREEVNFIQEFLGEGMMEIPEGGRQSVKHRIKEVAPCAEATEEELPDGSLVVTLDFGDGCETENGIVLAGKVILHLSFSDELSFGYSLEFINYYESAGDEESNATINGTSEGSISFDDKLTEQLSLDLTMAYEDGTEASFSSSQKTESSESEIRVVEFTSAGALRNGDSFTTTVIKPLVFSLSCGDEIHFPVKGVEIVSFNGGGIEINYGNGACDNVYTVK
jgi:hypothetical protein